MAEVFRFEEADAHRLDLLWRSRPSPARSAAYGRQSASCIDRDEVKAPGVGEDLSEQCFGAVQHVSADGNRFKFAAPLVEAARAEISDPDSAQVGVEVLVEDQSVCLQRRPR